MINLPDEVVTQLAQIGANLAQFIGVALAIGRRRLVLALPVVVVARARTRSLIMTIGGCRRCCWRARAGRARRRAHANCGRGRARRCARPPPLSVGVGRGPGRALPPPVRNHLRPRLAPGARQPARGQHQILVQIWQQDESLSGKNERQRGRARAKGLARRAGGCWWRGRRLCGGGPLLVACRRRRHYQHTVASLEVWRHSTLLDSVQTHIVG